MHLEGKRVKLHILKMNTSLDYIISIRLKYIFYCQTRRNYETPLSPFGLILHYFSSVCRICRVVGQSVCKSVCGRSIGQSMCQLVSLLFDQFVS